MIGNQILLCPVCSKTLPGKGYFCGACLNQFKCKSCDSYLEKDDTGCTECGTPKEVKSNPAESKTVFNSFRLHETEGGRTIEASFTNEVGKDLTGMLRDAYTNRHNNSANFKHSGLLNNGAGDSDSLADEVEDADADVIDEKVQPKEKSIPTKEFEYPTLKTIAMKRLPSTEPEWVLVYALYASKFGKETFKRKDIIQKYEESSRKSTAKTNGLSSCFNSLVNSDSINALANGDYSILDKGITSAKEIINRTSSSTVKQKGKGSKSSDTEEKEQNKSSSKPKKGTGDKGLKRLAEIDFVPKGKESLSDFYNKYTIKSSNEKNLLFVYYLQEVLKTSGITYNHLYTCYDALELKIPESFRQSVRNTKSATGWIETQDSENITLTVKGRNKIRFWDKND